MFIPVPSNMLFQGSYSPLQLELLFDELILCWRVKEVVDECSQFQREIVHCHYFIKAYQHVFFWEDYKMILVVSKTLP